MSLTQLPAINTKNLSPFGQSALTLDNDFAELDRLSGQIERLSIESDSGMERAKELLVKFGECGQRISTGVQSLAKSLEETRSRAETAAQSVASRAALIQERHHENERMLDRFRSLGDKVREVSTALAALKAPAKGVTEEGKALIAKQLPEFNAQLETLTAEAQKLKDDAREANMKTLERNADSLYQTLQSARRKLASIA